MDKIKKNMKRILGNINSPTKGVLYCKLNF